ncbi:hypothetical protein JNK13_06555 [bacterium]|nr:hypothetical protein [bacterium]
MSYNSVQTLTVEKILTMEHDRALALIHQLSAGTVKLQASNDDTIPDLLFAFGLRIAIMEESRTWGFAIELMRAAVGLDSERNLLASPIGVPRVGLSRLGSEYDAPKNSRSTLATEAELKESLEFLQRVAALAEARWQGTTQAIALCCIFIVRCNLLCSAGFLEQASQALSSACEEKDKLPKDDLEQTIQCTIEDLRRRITQSESCYRDLLITNQALLDEIETAANSTTGTYEDQLSQLLTWCRVVTSLPSYERGFCVEIDKQLAFCRKVIEAAGILLLARLGSEWKSSQFGVTIQQIDELLTGKGY